MNSTEVKELELRYKIQQLTQEHEIRKLKAELIDMQDRLSMQRTLNQELFRAYKLLQTREKERRDCTIRKVEAALEIKLYDWVINYVFSESTEGLMPDRRRWGRTTACILRLLLSTGEPIIVRCPVDLEIYAGPDAVTPNRLRYFWNEAYHMFRILKQAGGIDLREIKWK